MPAFDDTEIGLITNLVYRQLDVWSRIATITSGRPQVLLCGSSREQVQACLKALSNGPVNLYQLTVAVPQTNAPTTESVVFNQPKWNTVDWDESIYEEILVERVRDVVADQPIIVVVDFTPSLRRLRRIRQLLHKYGTLIIPAENPNWRKIDPQLMASFCSSFRVATDDDKIDYRACSSLVKLTECLPRAATSNQFGRILSSTASNLGYDNNPLPSFPFLSTSQAFFEITNKKR